MSIMPGWGEGDTQKARRWQLLTMIASDPRHDDVCICGYERHTHLHAELEAGAIDVGEVR